KFVNFYETGQELFEIMSGMEQRMGVQSFFVMDENFLLHRKRALELLELMQQHQKSWSLYVFSSGRVLQSYSMEQLLGLGVSWVWMGLEGEDSQYHEHKLRDVNTLEMVREMQANGIRVLGSSIIGLENHTPENIDAVIDYAIKHDTDFHQFMLYTPVPGTPLYEEHRNLGTLYEDMDEADTHGQFRFNFKHPHISRDQSGEILIRAFNRDFDVNGPSVMRIARTLLQGWLRHKNHPDARIRRRIHREAEGLSMAYSSALWATEVYFREKKPQLASKAAVLREKFTREFGLTGKLVAPVGGALVRMLMAREEKRLNSGWTYQPPLFVDRRNWELLPQPE
ncbi:MAG: hypothetical protein LUO89_03395, partial [Methanothrix sp.]|nr:hypothetical protein [Methanothrix sp.]